MYDTDCACSVSQKYGSTSSVSQKNGSTSLNILILLGPLSHSLNPLTSVDAPARHPTSTVCYQGDRSRSTFSIISTSRSFLCVYFDA